jgi:hypothetical protein
MTLGALAFLNPWLLAALATLPLIYWLLRTVPPRPRGVVFPPERYTRLESREKTPAKTPWWLLLIRLAAAALVILALAEPVLKPSRETAFAGTGPVVIVIDNGWAGAPRWAERTATAQPLIGEAESWNRPVIVLATAAASRPRPLRLEAPADARGTLAAMTPEPYAPNRSVALALLEDALRQGSDAGDPSIVWLSDGIDHDGRARTFADGLKALARGGTLSIVGDRPGREALGLAAAVGAGGKLSARLVRAGGPAREVAVHAYSARGERLAEAPLRLGDDAATGEVTFELPLELRNQVTRVEIAGERSAGAVSLLDSRSQWQRVGLISGESQEQSQPLLAPLYYIDKAIRPFAEVIRTKGQNLAQGIDTLLGEKVSVMMLADIGTLSGDVRDRVGEWVKRGGVLVRFAGPRLENGGDDLLAVGLRTGGRALGGALSWSTPQPLAPFDEASLFFGLSVPSDVSVSRQVLADPAQLTPDVKVWARLGDGTPLVTAADRGAGRIVLFHVTANSDWSNLPISGLFVEMLRRVTALGTLSGVGEGAATGAEAGGSRPTESKPADALAPVQTLDGYGALRRPPPTAEAIPAAKLASIVASPQHPPGYYGAPASPRALNVLTYASTLAPLPPLPEGTVRLAYESQASTNLKPWLLAAALALLFIDIAAVLVLSTAGAAGLALARRRAAAVLVLAGLAAATFPHSARAQEVPRAPERPRSQTSDVISQKATANVTLGYVLTGNTAADTTSRLGLAGLSRVLAVRTAVEPGEPMGVDIVNDEIAFFPVLYWPVLEDAKPLPEPALAKIDAYMKQGGMIIFDTRDYGSGRATGLPPGGPSGNALQRLLGSLDVPRLEPVPEDHVLTKSFYLLRSFPGRWDGGQLWVEAESGADDGGRKARRADGVTSIIITSNDLASAWALDDSGRPLYPVVPGGENQREMAMRCGINIVMHALTGNYKADQVHVPHLLERLGQ